MLKLFTKTGRILTVILAIVAIASVSSSCKKDDDGPSSGNSSLTGTWYQIDEDGWSYELVFKSNGTGSITVNTNPSSRSIWEEFFNWTTNQSSDGDTYLTVIHTGGDEVDFGGYKYNYILAGNTLLISGWGTFTKSK